MPVITINGRKVTAVDGATVAAAILANGITAFRRSVSGEPRAALCGMGICFECRVTIDGRPHEKSCQISCRDGMAIET